MTPVYLFPPRTRRPPGYSTSPRQRAAGPHHLHVVYQQGAPFSDTGRVHKMFTIDHNKSFVNFTGSDVLRLQKPNHASHLTVGGSWYQRVHCLNLSHSQRGKVCSTNCTRQLSTLYWTHHMTRQLKLNNYAGCMRKRSLLSRCPTYFIRLGGQTKMQSTKHLTCEYLSGETKTAHVVVS